VAQGPAAVPLRGRARRIAAGVAGAAGVALAALALVPAYLSVRFDERGERTWTASPDDAFRDLERAADLAPLSPRPQLRAGTLAIDVRRYRLAEKLFRSSIEREDTWYARFELALLASRAGKSREAEHQIRIARTLNREDRFVSEAHTKISQGKRVSPERFEREMLELNRARFTAPRI
jgi:tetratricopeptide (TPR) repeat protein